MTGRKGWDIDLRDGEAREDAFVYVLLSARVEHKRDFKCAATGNLAIEFETSQFASGQGQKWPSGIATTTADYWAIEFDDDAWVLQRTSRLKALAKRAYQEHRIKWCGDDDRFHNALVPFEWLNKPPALAVAA